MSLGSVNLQKKIDHLWNQNKNLLAENERLYGIIRLLKKDKFGSKAERFSEVPPEQLAFDNIKQEVSKEPEKSVTVTYKRKKGRSPGKGVPDDLPREEKIIDLPEEEKTCPHDGTRLECIGSVDTEKIKTVPAQTSIVVEKRLKYVCPCCKDHMKEAKSLSLLPGTVTTPELLSFIVFSKFFQALPLYRLEEMYKLQGIDMKRSNMARWLIQVSEKLVPVWNILEDMMLDSGYVTIDATTLQVLKEQGRHPQTKSFMWVRGSPEKGIVLFDYNVSGGGAVARELMKGFKGTLQGDAHRGYGSLDLQNITLLGCMMHARRRFYKAWLEANKSKGLASRGLYRMNEIYKKEEEYKKRKFTAQERKQWRDEQVVPLMEDFKKWCQDNRAKVFPKSRIGNAIHYFINEYDELSGFLKNGRYEIDNGWVERQIKKYAIGRKNWVFCDTVEGAKATAILYSIVLTMKLNRKDPFETLVRVLDELPRAETGEDYQKIVDLMLSPENTSCIKKEGVIIH